MGQESTYYCMITSGTELMPDREVRNKYFLNGQELKITIQHRFVTGYIILKY